MIVADISIIPIGNEKTDLGKYIKEAVKVIEKSGLKYVVTSMGTQIEANNLNELYSTIQEAQEAIFKCNIKRVYTTRKIDDRRDKNNRGMEDKIKSVLE
ncbi:MAG: MTH1187 family thiamine-binding protein [Methanobrevibacter sp.]|jgi:uncharacterized protein (TIGR00106 family)|nr:MTH1187 family thiamine-binding protein [Methanobrevibacter sp.]